MSQVDPTDPIEIAHQRFQKLVRLGLLAILGALVVGGIGGFFVYQALDGQGAPRIVLFIPGLIAAVAFGLPVRRLRYRWFENDEALLAAQKREPYPAPASDAGIEVDQAA